VTPERLRDLAFWLVSLARLTRIVQHGSLRTRMTLRSDSMVLFALTCPFDGFKVKFCHLLEATLERQRIAPVIVTFELFPRGRVRMPGEFVDLAKTACHGHTCESLALVLNAA
jgi:hypothetical protein